MGGCWEAVKTQKSEKYLVILRLNKVQIEGNSVLVCPQRIVG